MLFPTVDFGIFLCLVFLGHWLLNPRPLPWKLFMIGASYVFYAWWDWHFVWLLAGVSAIAQVGALAVSHQEAPGRRRAVTIAAVAATLAPLAYFKYYGFFALNVTNAFARLGINAGPPLIQVILPVGVSFIGRAWSESVLVRIASAFERATRHRRPPAFAPHASTR